MSFKRQLYLWHRYLGIGLCLLFVLWFVSGIIMMYVGFPELTEHERLDGLEPLAADAIRVGLDEALANAGLDQSPRRIRMTTVLERPAYHFLAGNDRWRSVFADTGERLHSLSPDQAVRATGTGNAEYIDRMELDQWTVSGSLQPYRPLHEIALNDKAASVWYVSDRTGEVVRDTSRFERGWNWIGAVVHWIYPVQLRRLPQIWSWLVIVLSSLGVIVAVTGTITGTLRLRLRRLYRGNRHTPYRGLMRWHHILGLTGAVFVFTWIFSGLMSMNPFDIFPRKSPPAGVMAEYRGGELNAVAFNLQADRAVRRSGLDAVKEIEWQLVAGQPYLVLRESANRSRTMKAADNSSPERFVASRDVRAALQAGPGDYQLQWLHRQDAYYYSHHDHRRLPIIRAVFNDPRQTWFHVDPHSGAVIERSTFANRVQRWLFNGLHSLDFGFLIRNRPLWDGVVIGLSLLGLALSLTSVVIGWRRLRRGL